MAKAVWNNRNEAVKKAMYKVLKGFNVESVCEAVAQESISNVENMTDKQFNDFVKDVSKEVEKRSFYRNI